MFLGSMCVAVRKVFPAQRSLFWGTRGIPKTFSKVRDRVSPRLFDLKEFENAEYLSPSDLLSIETLISLAYPNPTLWGPPVA